MECLKNRIGILGCDAFTQAASEGPPAVEALPVLLVNTLPGITFEKIASIADSEQETFLGVWGDITLRAMKKFEILVKAKLNQCYKITDKAVIECLVCEKKELFDVALWYLHGTEVMIEVTSTDTLNRYTTIDLEKAEQLKTDFYTEFQAALEDAVQGINPKDSECLDGACVECRRPVTFVMQTP